MAITPVDSGQVTFAVATTAYTLPLPADIAAGQVLAVQVTTRDGHAISALPSGGTTLISPQRRGTDSVSYSVHTWVAPATPPADVTFTLAAPLAGNLTWTRVTGADGTMSGTAGIDTSWPLDVKFVAPAAVTADADALVIGGVCIPSGSRTTTPPTGWTQVAVGGERIGALGIKGVQAVAGSTGTADRWDISGTAIRGSAWQLALRPGAGEPVTPTPALLYSWLGIPAASGQPISARVTNASSVRVRVGTDAAVTTGVQSSAWVTPGASGWVKVTVPVVGTGSRWYVVEMQDADGVASDSAIAGPFTVAGGSSFTFGFGSCLESGSTTGSAFTRLLARTPALFFHLGDFHYADNVSTSADSHRGDIESQIAGNAGLRTLLASVPTWYTKSDHDSGGGNGVLPGAWTGPNRTAHLEAVPTLPQVDPDALYASFVVGRVRFICTDHRYLRTATSMMGATQKAWFKAELAQPEPVKIWVQDSPWVNHDAPQDPASGPNDKWSDYPAEHTELGDYIAASAVGQVVTIHGDMHALAADDGTNNDWGSFPTFGAAPFDKNASIKGGPYSEGTYPTTSTGTPVQQYGMVTVTDDGDHVTLAYRGYDSTDTQRIALDVVVDTVQSGGSTAPVTAAAAGAGTRTTSSGTTPTVTVTPSGAGRVVARGGSTASVTTTPVGAGVRLSSAGATTTTTTTTTGAGLRRATGATTALTTITPQGSGWKSARGGQAPSVQVAATGSGRRVEAGQGGSVATTTSTPTGAGVAYRAGGSGAAVTVAVHGAGQPVTPGGGGSTADVTIIATGTGIALRRGGATTTITATATGSGRNPDAGRDITITVTGPVAHPMRVTGPVAHPLAVTEPTRHPLTVTGPRSA